MYNKLSTSQFSRLPNGYGFSKWWYYTASYKICYVAVIEDTHTIDFYEKPTQRVLAELRHRIIENGRRYEVGNEPRR